MIMEKEFVWNEIAFEEMARALKAGFSPEKALMIYREVDMLTSLPMTVHEYFQAPLTAVLSVA